jgi:hypothetical protein
VKDIGQQRIDITTIKMVMKPVQRAVKDVSKSISDSPLYHAALRPPNHSNHSFGPTSPQSLAPAFQGGYQGNFTANLNTALAQSLPMGPPTNVPATPLAAALGPAAQATLSYPQGEYFSSHSATPSSAGGVRGMHERLDTMMQHPGGGGYNQYGQQQQQQQQQQHPQYQQYQQQQQQPPPHYQQQQQQQQQNHHHQPQQQSQHHQPQHTSYAGFPNTARRVDMNR